MRQINIKVSEELYQAIREASKRDLPHCPRPLSQWVRETLSKASKPGVA
jgi:hypothetical protein